MKFVDMSSWPTTPTKWLYNNVKLSPYLNTDSQTKVVSFVTRIMRGKPKILDFRQIPRKAFPILVFGQTQFC